MARITRFEEYLMEWKEATEGAEIRYEIVKIPSSVGHTVEQNEGGKKMERLEKQGIATIAVGLGGIALSLYEMSHGHNPGPILEIGAPANVLLGGVMVALSKVI